MDKRNQDGPDLLVSAEQRLSAANLSQNKVPPIALDAEKVNVAVISSRLARGEDPLLAYGEGLDVKKLAAP